MFPEMLQSRPPSELLGIMQHDFTSLTTVSQH